MATQVDLQTVSVEKRRIKNEPEWHEGSLGRYTDEAIAIDIEKGVQQNENLKPFYKDIVRAGLHEVYKNYKDKKDPFDPPQVSILNVHRHHEIKKTTKPRKVIIVGAGMAGLSAAYELKRAGHDVQILEMQQRAGGRVKTFGEADGFAKGLYVDGGAMRLPGKCDDEHKRHYLTDLYVKKFKLATLPFQNSDKNAFVKFYDMKPMTFTEWEGTDEGFTSFCNTWPKWNTKIAHLTPRINNINEYFDKTLHSVTMQLKSRLRGVKSYSESGKIWTKWVRIWSQFSVNGFLRSDLSAVLSKLHDKEYYDEIQSSDLGKYIPWPEEAITAYSVFNYTEQLDQDLVQYLRDDLGKWWSPDMHRIQGGMSKLPQSFYEELKEDITFNVTVNGVQFLATKDNLKVKVTGYYSTSCQPCQFEGEAIIITTPINLIRQMKIKNMIPDCKVCDPKDTMNSFFRAIEDIWYGPSTKIMIQTKSRFWACNEDKTKNITGGFSKTSLPIGQLFYTPPPENGSEKGLLLAYTWKSEALQFGSLHPHVAIREAVRQISEIHKEVEEEFEVGAVQAWYNEPSAQGAYVLLKPHQYRNVEQLMYYPIYNVFFAGDGISFAAGWIQGALESGLRAAYQFYARNEEDNLSELLH